MNNALPVYVINLPERKDRLDHIIKEFAPCKEFSLVVTAACRHEVGAIGLWQSIHKIVQQAADKDEDMIILCEDDHQFTENYSTEYLLNAIEEARQLNADIVLGGVSWFCDILQVSKNFFWTKSFTGTQFVILFKETFAPILEAELGENETADKKLCQLFDNILIMHPFISLQKEFGYSDATTANNNDGRVMKLFETAIGRMDKLSGVRSYYEELPVASDETTDYSRISIPTYIINLPERTERLAHIIAQFENRPEFDVTIIEACKHTIGAYGLFQSMRRVIQMAINNDDDVIIICEDDHEFTTSYSRDYLLENIIGAHHQGADYLSGGSGKIDHAVPITENRYWVSLCLSTQFIVLYKKFFRQILDEPFDEKVIADQLFSEMTSNKMILYPFVSRQKDFGYSDVTPVHNEREGLVQRMFTETAARLDTIRQAYTHYNQQTQLLSVATI